MNFTKLLSVARWEFTEKAKTKAFIIGLFLTPLIMVGFGAIPSILAMKEDSDSKLFAFYDETGTFGAELQKEFNEKYQLENGKPNYILVNIDTKLFSPEKAIEEYSPRILKEDVVGMLIIRKNIVETRQVEYRGQNIGNVRDIENMTNAIEQILIARQLVAFGINEDVYKRVSKPVSATKIKIDKSGAGKESNFGETFGTAYGSIMLLFILIISTGQLLVRSLMEEKSNRIVEILLSSCSPFELMMGKLLGLSGLGVLQALTWAVLGIGAALYFNASLAFLANLPLIVVFMILGYVLYASILVGLGSLTTNEQEAQQITGYVSMFLMVPIMFLVMLMQNPNAPIVKILTYIPLLTPTFMAMRISIMMPAWWEIALSIGIMLISIVGVMYVSSKIFRVAILMYGKRPTLPEVIGFLKEK